MTLDGYTFRMNSSWIRRHTALSSLTVAHLSHATTYQGILDVHWALQTVFQMANITQARSGQLRHLTFRDLNFAPPASMLQPFILLLDLPCTGLEYLTFEDVDPWFLEEVTCSIVMSPADRHSRRVLQKLHLTYGARFREIPIKYHYQRLVLEAYDRPLLDTNYKFSESNFICPELHLINCPGFTDSSLGLLSRVDPVTKRPLFSTNLTFLKLTDCRNFTIQALKDMVKARAMYWWEGSRTAIWDKRRLNSLEVSGYGAPLLAYVILASSAPHGRKYRCIKADTCSQLAMKTTRRLE